MPQKFQQKLTEFMEQKESLFSLSRLAYMFYYCYIFFRCIHFDNVYDFLIKIFVFKYLYCGKGYAFFHERQQTKDTDGVRMN